MTSNKVEIALTIGVAPVLIWEKIYIGKVNVSAPEQKNEIKKSSNEIIIISKAPDIIDGNKIGIIIL